MQETWETIKSIKTLSKITINTEISNKGNVRIVAYYKDKYIKSYNLSLGHGLYAVHSNNGYVIHIYGCSGEIFRHVYFMKYTGHQYIKGWQIHHIDYNHCNNCIDNLLYCSAKEHGMYHKFQFKLGNEAQGYNTKWNTEELKQLELYNKSKEYYKYLEDNKDNFNIDNAKQYIKDIRNEIEQIAKPIIEQDRIETNKQREYNRKQKLLNSGKYIEVDGNLVRVKTKRVMTDYQKQCMAEGRRRNCYNNPEWRDKCRTGLLKYLQENNGHYRKSKENQLI